MRRTGGQAEVVHPRPSANGPAICGRLTEAVLGPHPAENAGR
eukprot:CAMPEP_0179198988 /NCGR_PEP_ID=MMETSP0796-20121207/98990_1 /TAXON_ID=73915 /ORGANISM="Pyrodinium bahamense, Strain pbaha01" /LENGTH=41 /DNA_ID= /DNA_START= /DNA_END= /DNA_ORIENTATION=